MQLFYKWFQTKVKLLPYKVFLSTIFKLIQFSIIFITLLICLVIVVGDAALFGNLGVHFLSMQDLFLNNAEWHIEFYSIMLIDLDIIQRQGLASDWLVWFQQLKNFNFQNLKLTSEFCSEGIQLLLGLFAYSNFSNIVILYLDFCALPGDYIKVMCFSEYIITDRAVIRLTNWIAIWFLIKQSFGYSISLNLKYCPDQECLSKILFNVVDQNIGFDVIQQWSCVELPHDLVGLFILWI